MTSEKDESNPHGAVMQTITRFSLTRILEDLERRLKKKMKQFAGRIALTFTGLCFMVIAAVFVSVSLVKVFSTMLNPATSWGVVGLILALLGFVLMLLGQLVT